MSNISVPNSLQYTFKEDLDWFPIEKGSQPNYLIAAFLYNNSFLQENLEAQPFDFIQDPIIRTELTCTQYFIEGDKPINLRRVEDLVVLDYKPKLTKFPSNHTLLPIQHELKKEFKYLEEQVGYYKKSLFNIWVGIHYQELFKFDCPARGVNHPYQIGCLFH